MMTDKQDDAQSKPGEVRSSDELGRVAYEAWCHAGRQIAAPWELKNKYERLHWSLTAKAVAEAVQSTDDIARAVQAESILLAEGWMWSKERSEWMKA